MAALTPAEIWEQLDALAARFEPDVAKAFLRAVARLKAEVSPELLEYVVQTGDIKPLVDKLDFTDFRLAVRESLMRMASAEALPFEVRFDALHYSAIRAMQTAELSLVSNLTNEIVAGIRQFLVAGLREGINPVETARNLRNIIGLTQQQAQAVFNYQRLLTGGVKGQPYKEVLRRALRDRRFDSTVLRAIEERTPLRPEQITSQVKRYEERMLKQRAETIARTETMNALELAQQSRWRQAIDNGEVSESALRRFWHTAKDERVCPICSQIPGLNPEGVAFSQPFVLPDGTTLMGPTAHPNCRCVTFTRIVFQKNVLVFNLRELAQTLSGLRKAA